MSVRSISAALVATLIAAPALGEAATPESEPSITGNWSFQSETFEGCSFGGTAFFNPTADGETTACELTARQSCIGSEWVVRQSCTATRTGNRLLVESTIEEFLVGEPSPSYWPDNFHLKIRSTDRMTGVLVSHGTHPAEFVRQAAGIS